MRPIHPNRRKGEIAHHLHLFTQSTKQWFHIENLSFLRLAMKLFFRFSFLAGIGYKNAQKIELNIIRKSFRNLPEAFSGFKILYISDIHIDCIKNLPELINSLVEPLDYDICLLGGDYRFRIRGNPLNSFHELNKIIPLLKQKSPVFAVLGNHDQYETAQFLSSQGIDMLINENRELIRDGESLFIIGVDDGHYFNAMDLDLALHEVPKKEFKLLLCHSPEFYEEAESAGIDIYLAGHTHGGQVCLPGRIPIIYNAPVKRCFISGPWEYNQLQGYTSRGAGTSLYPVRFFCPPEITLIELVKG